MIPDACALGTGNDMADWEYVAKSPDITIHIIRTATTQKKMKFSITDFFIFCAVFSCCYQLTLTRFQANVSFLYPLET